MSDSRKPMKVALNFADVRAPGHIMTSSDVRSIMLDGHDVTPGVRRIDIVIEAGKLVDVKLSIHPSMLSISPNEFTAMASVESVEPALTAPSDERPWFRWGTTPPTAWLPVEIMMDGRVYGWGFRDENCQAYGRWDSDPVVAFGKPMANIELPPIQRCDRLSWRPMKWISPELVGPNVLILALKPSGEVTVCVTPRWWPNPQPLRPIRAQDVVGVIPLPLGFPDTEFPFDPIERFGLCRECSNRELVPMYCNGVALDSRRSTPDRESGAGTGVPDQLRTDALIRCWKCPACGHSVAEGDPL